MIKRITQVGLLLGGLGLVSLGIGQPPTERQYLCPTLQGTYQNGQTVKNVDGNAWMLTINASGAHQFDIKHWSSRSVTPSQNNYLLICKTSVNQVMVQVQLTVTNMDSCYVIPEINYQLFGCFKP